MSGHRRLLVSIALGLIASAGSAADEERPRLEIRRAATPPVIDGVLDDEAWRGAALPLTRWLTYNPLSGEKLTQE
ncbi:MAG TPA: hypothetical protein VMR21_16505, partial [Vicinamibacteria bacterium]|nr:hypothetical protein [Vicinamibacteria bacterium]